MSLKRICVTAAFPAVVSSTTSRESVLIFVVSRLRREIRHWYCDYTGCCSAVFESETALILHLLYAHKITCAKTLVQKCSRLEKTSTRENSSVMIDSETDSFLVGLPPDLQLIVRYREESERELYAELRQFSKKCELPREPEAYVNCKSVNNITEELSISFAYRKNGAGKPSKTCQSLESLSVMLENFKDDPCSQEKKKKLSKKPRETAVSKKQPRRARTMQCLRLG